MKGMNSQIIGQSIRAKTKVSRAVIRGVINEFTTLNDHISASARATTTMVTSGLELSTNSSCSVARVDVLLVSSEYAIIHQG